MNCKMLLGQGSKLLAVFLILILISCNSNDYTTQIVHENSSKDIEDVNLFIDTKIVLTFQKPDWDSLNAILPEFKEEIVLGTDDLYETSLYKKLNDCEVCRDNYYLIYTYYLKKQNTAKVLDFDREVLINLFKDINSLFRAVYDGGTFFGHQSYRLYALVEHELYLNDFTQNKDISTDIEEKKGQLMSDLKNNIDYIIKANEDEAFHIDLDRKEIDELIIRISNNIISESTLTSANKFIKEEYEWGFEGY